AERRVGSARRVDAAVAYPDGDRLALRFGTHDLDRPDDAALDRDALGRVEQLEARLGAASRLAVAVEAPAGDEGRMTDDDAGDVALHLDAASRDQEAVEREPGLRLAPDAQVVGLRRL